MAREKLRAEAVAIGGMMSEQDELEKPPLTLEEKRLSGTADCVTVHAADRSIFRFHDGKKGHDNTVKQNSTTPEQTEPRSAGSGAFLILSFPSFLSQGVASRKGGSISLMNIESNNLAILL